MLLSSGWKGVIPLLTKQYIDDHQLVERYLADQLSDAEREQFESYYVEHPEILSDLQAAAGIKLGAALLRKSGELMKLTSQPRSARWRPSLALAASLALILGAGYFLRGGSPEPTIMTASLSGFATPLSEAATYQVQRTRSDVDAIVPLPSSPKAIKLRVRPVFDPQPAAYRIELAAVAEDESLTPVASLNALRLDGDGFITLYVNSAFLKPGNYQLNVANGVDVAGSATANEFLLEVVGAEQAQRVAE